MARPNIERGIISFNVPILCFEGPSAVGKTTAAAALAVESNVCVVPEVHDLFDRPGKESADWYFERQVDRWRRAVEGSRQAGVAVLDGDPFQPLWYNWAYDYAGWQDLSVVERFYRPRLERGEIEWPDLYVVFGAPADTLRARKAADPTRARRNFDIHLQFIEPQRRYFSALEQFAPGRVLFIDADEIERTQILSAALVRSAEQIPPVELLDRLVAWLRDNAP